MPPGIEPIFLGNNPLCAAHDLMRPNRPTPSKQDKFAQFWFSVADGGGHDRVDYLK